MLFDEWPRQVLHQAASSEVEDAAALEWPWSGGHLEESSRKLSSDARLESASVEAHPSSSDTYVSRSANSNHGQQSKISQANTTPSLQAWR